MEEDIKIIKSANISKREEIIVGFARWLETASQEALVYGEGRFAMMSASMAEAMRFNADRLARENPEKAERVLQQASAIMAQFKAAYPHRVDPSTKAVIGPLDLRTTQGRGGGGEERGDRRRIRQIV